MAAPPCQPMLTSPPADGRATPALLKALIGVEGFLGVTALGGGIELIAFPHGNRFVDGEWLDHIPLIDSYRLPGAALAGLFGVGALGTAVALARRRRPRRRLPRRVETWTDQHWAWASTIGIGAALIAWIGLEVALLPQRDPIEALYAAVGGALVALPVAPSVRAALRSPA